MRVDLSFSEPQSPLSETRYRRMQHDRLVEILNLTLMSQ